MDISVEKVEIEWAFDKVNEFVLKYLCECVNFKAF